MEKNEQMGLGRHLWGLRCGFWSDRRCYSMAGMAGRPVALLTSRVSSHLRQMRPNVNAHRTHISVYTTYINPCIYIYMHICYRCNILYIHIISYVHWIAGALPKSLSLSFSLKIFLDRFMLFPASGNVTHLVAVEHVHCLPSMYAEAPGSMNQAWELEHLFWNETSTPGFEKALLEFIVRSHYKTFCKMWVPSIKSHPELACRTCITSINRYTDPPKDYFAWLHTNFGPLSQWYVLKDRWLLTYLRMVYQSGYLGCNPSVDEVSLPNWCVVGMCAYCNLTSWSPNIINSDWAADSSLGHSRRKTWDALEKLHHS